MSIFHFHTQDGECLLDRDGTELPSLEAAKDAAIQVLSETLNRQPALFWKTESFKIFVTDHGGDQLFVLEVSASGPKGGSVSRAVQVQLDN